jgi:hypothetical protein
VHNIVLFIDQHACNIFLLVFQCRLCLYLGSLVSLQTVEVVIGKANCFSFSVHTDLRIPQVTKMVWASPTQSVLCLSGPQLGIL